MAIIMRAQGSWLAARAADLRNILLYGNRAGPSAEQLIQRYKTWDKALEAISRTNPTVNRIMGAGSRNALPSLRDADDRGD